MIPVAPAPEPPDFDSEVRQLGQCALAELTGQPPPIKRRGPRRKQLVLEGVPVTKIADIPSKSLPDLWTKAIPDMLERYGRICAYVCVYIERIIGAPSIDHWIPKSVDPERAYEWDNFRLACSLMNSRKGTKDMLLDPFEIGEGWFELEFVCFQVISSRRLPPHQQLQAAHTVEELHLNCSECLSLRRSQVEAYAQVHVSFEHLEGRSPFVARELRRQGLVDRVRLRRCLGLP